MLTRAPAGVDSTFTRPVDRTDSSATAGFSGTGAGARRGGVAAGVRGADVGAEAVDGCADSTCGDDFRSGAGGVTGGCSRVVVPGTDGATTAAEESATAPRSRTTKNA